ncbi:Peptidase family M1 domain [Popillia japonica]|uniref:Peptidase family M1 domain n=1 Tax=Popillia japonica TaxID=7064 RepID=A0AAW1L9W0_POPJA
MVAKFVLIIWAILGVALSQFPDVPDSDIRKISPINDGTYRLPGDTVPNHYDITLEPNFQEFTFDVRMLGASALLPVGSTSEEPDLHFFRIHLESTVQSGDILEVTLFYTGNLNTENRGFYRASYFEDGNIKWFGTTHFAATEARRAFPCYDEPALKAIFTIHIIRPATYNSVSNTDPAGAPVPVDGKFRDDFQDTVLMSTYLVAFVVSEMTSTGRLNNQAVIAAPALIIDGRGDYGRQTGIDSLQAMADFTGIPYSLSKLDQVGLPDPWFTSGAMENWGLVIYRERYILWKSGISTSSDRQNVASIIAHELSHQWFGNLVSPLWWTYLWLSEGFATYFEHYATNIVEPGMRMMDQYVTAVNQRAMDNDATTITRPMSYYAETPTAIRALFDRIAYQKSGAVIRMMEHFLTPG